MQFRHWKCFNFDTKNPMNFVPKGPTDSESSLVLVMAWCKISDNPLHSWTNHDPVQWRIYASPGLNELSIPYWQTGVISIATSLTLGNCIVVITRSNDGFISSVEFPACASKKPFCIETGPSSFFLDMNIINICYTGAMVGIKYE